MAKEEFILLTNPDREYAGVAEAEVLMDGRITVKMDLIEKYEFMRPGFRQRIEDYMGAVPWYRAPTFGDRNPHG